MVQQSLNIAYSDGSSQVLWEDGERVFSRGWRLDDNGNRLAVLLVAPAADHPSRSILDRLTHEYELKDELDGAWAARPLALMRDAGRTVLVLDDLGGEPLDRLLGEPMEVGRFLRLAIAVTSALGKLHQRGLIHKDIKPANIVVDCADGHVRLTGFGIASRLSRERQAPEPPETIAGTLAYMAPEQTGRMNRSIDARSDLYALGVTLYQMLTGVLPLTAADPMEWVHCHIARKPVPPGERLESVPAPVSAIIMKLLAKTPEDRYQTAGGVERDLRRCLAEWEARRRIDDFPLGLQDTPNQLLIPEKLYGRDREIATLLSCFDRIIKTRCARVGAGLRIFRHRQVLSRRRTAQGAGAAARPVRVRQVRPVQARYPLRDTGAGFSKSRPASPQQERHRVGKLAPRASGGAGIERAAHDRPHTRTQANHRRPATGS